MDSTISEMKKVVDMAIMKLPSRIKTMTMETFMREYGGQTALVLEKERKMNKLARSTVKIGGGISSRIATVLKTTSRASRIPGGVLREVEPDTRERERAGDSDTDGITEAPGAKVDSLTTVRGAVIVCLAQIVVG